MQQLFYNYIFKSVIIIFTTLAFFTFPAAGIRVQDQKFEGYQVKFDYENYPEEREIAYQYYLDKESKHLLGLERQDMGIDLFDIDDNGEKEILLYVDGGDSCPDAGCPFAILRKIKVGATSYQTIPFIGHFAMHKSYTPKIIDSSYLSYHDIIFGENEKLVSLWRWNGRYYDGKYIESKAKLIKLIKNGE